MYFICIFTYFGAAKPLFLQAFIMYFDPNPLISCVIYQIKAPFGPVTLPTHLNLTLDLA